MFKKFTFMTAAAAIFIATATVPVSCQKSDPEQDGDNGSEVTEVYGTYTFGEETNDIVTSTYAENDSYYVFTLSPMTGVSVSTYIIFGMSKHFADGKEHDVNDYYNQLDNGTEYILVYEDPVHYYSNSWDLESGTLMIKANGNDSFTLKVDGKLNDGTVFKIDYDGPVTPDK